MNRVSHTTGTWKNNWKKIQAFLLGGSTTYLILIALVVIPLLLTQNPGPFWTIPYFFLFVLMFPPVAIFVVVVSGLLTVLSSNKPLVSHRWGLGGWRLFIVAFLVVSMLWGIILLDEYYR